MNQMKNRMQALGLLDRSFKAATDEELVAAVESVAQLLRETIDLADGLYQPRYMLPK